MDPSDVDLTQLIQGPEDTEDQNADNNIHAVLKVEVDVSPPKFLTFTLKAGSNVIGRSPLCDVVIGNNAVSKRHAQLELDKHGMTIMDLGSLNKTKIGKRALKPRVRFNLEYNETFFLAGIPAHVMRDNDVAGDDTEWDTCSESLLNAAEVAEDQAGVVEAVVHSNSSTVDCHSERVDGELEHPACASTADGKQVAKPSSQSDFKTPSSHESRSSGSFNLPEMPSLEYTQSDSSQLAEPCAEDGSRKNNGATEDAVVPAGDDPSLGNSAMPKDAGDERRLLSPADISFVLCEATLSDNEEENDDYYCPPTRKTTVVETPPHLPYFVPESDPEDDDLSMVTASVQALDCKSTEAKDGSGDKISAAEPVAEGSDATSKQSVNDDKEPVSVDAEGKDEPEEVLSETEEEADRTSTAKGRKKKAPSAKKGRGKKGAAPPSSKKKAAAERASRRGKGRAKQLEVREDLPAAECMPSDAVEDSTVSVGTRNVRAPRGGKKGAKGLSQDQENKKLESSVVSAVEECSEAPTAQSPTTSRHVGVRADRASEERTLATSTEVASKTTQRGRKTKASAAKVNKDKPQKSEPIKSSSRGKNQDIDEAEVEAEAVELPKKLPTRCRGSKVAPAAVQGPVAKRRNAQGKVNEDLLPDSAMATEETLEETLPTCSPPKIAKTTRHVASVSFGVGRRESEGEATTGEEEDMEEIEMMPGPKSKRKPAAKNIKQEALKEAPKRGKRKAALAEDVALGTPPKVTAEPAERDVLSPPSAKMALRRKPKILFTGMECTNEEEIVKRLGGAIATTASTCTHLVTDKFLRTVKSLCCIGKGTPIVDVAWIKKCQEAKTFVEHTPYLLKDTEAEKSLKFVLDETLRQASSSGGVLQGWSIHATGRVLPSPADLKEIVSCAGGKYLAKMPTRATGGSTVIVSCKEDLKACTQAKKNGVPVVSVEFVLSGLLQYKLDVNAHSLN